MRSDDAQLLQYFGVMVILVAYTSTWVNANTKVQDWLDKYLEDEKGSGLESNVGYNVTSYHIARSVCLILLVKIWAWFFVAMVMCVALQRYVISPLTHVSKYGTTYSILFNNVGSREFMGIILTTYFITFVAAWFTIGRILSKATMNNQAHSQHIKSMVSNVMIFNLILVLLTVSGHLILKKN